MSTFPYMPLFAGDYLADTDHLSTEEHGAYLLLIMAMWRRDGWVPDDDKDLARMTRLSPAKWRAVRKRLSPLLMFRAGEISQKRVLIELKNAQDYSKKQSANAHKRWDSHRKKNKRLANATALPADMPNVCTHPHTQLKKDSPTESPKKTAKGTRLPEDWQPPDKPVKDITLTPAQIAAEVPKFIDYWCAQPGQRGMKLKWDATWRNWLRTAQERLPRVRAGPAKEYPPGVRPNGSGYYLSPGSEAFDRWKHDAEKRNDMDTYWKFRKAEREGKEVHMPSIWPRSNA